MRVSTEWGINGIPVIELHGLKFVDEEKLLGWIARPVFWLRLPAEMSERISPLTGAQINDVLEPRFYQSAISHEPGFVYARNVNRVTDFFAVVERYPEEDQVVVIGLLMMLLGDKGSVTFESDLIESWNSDLLMALRLLVMGVSPEAVLVAMEERIDVDLMSAL